MGVCSVLEPEPRGQFSSIQKYFIHPGLMNELLTVKELLLCLTPWIGMLMFGKTQ